MISDTALIESISLNKIPKSLEVPPYVYQNQPSQNLLLQGDILKLTGMFREYFIKFYPEVTLIENEEKYVMVLTQSCDLIKGHKRKLKVSHINVCLIKSLKSFISKLIPEEIRPLSIGNINLLERETNDRLKDKLSKLLNNSGQKINFFLPKQPPFTEDMVAIIPLTFSFRTDHYDLLLNNKILTLTPEFRTKVGYIVSELYGRVGTPDLSDAGWGDKQIRDYINDLLNDFHLMQVPDKSFLEYVQKNFNGDNCIIEDLIVECQAKNRTHSFKAIKNELKQNLRTELLRLFENKEKMSCLLTMQRYELSKEISELFRKIDR